MPRPKINRSEKVREFLAKYPEASNKEIAVLMKKAKIPAVDTSLISVIRTSLNKKQGKSRPEPTSRDRSEPTMRELVSTKRFLQTMGSIKRANRVMKFYQSLIPKE